MVFTRSDLAQTLSQVCKFMPKPGKQHWKAIKWILRCLKGTTDRDIMFNMEQGVASVVGYVNSNYVGDLDNMRSTTEYVFTLTGVICQSIVYCLQLRLNSWK